MDIEITLTDRHIAGLCIAYGYKELNEDGTANKVSAYDFATSKIVAFIDEVASSVDLNSAVALARSEKVIAIEREEKPIIREKLKK